MNGKEKRRYQREYASVNRKFQKKHYPKVYKAVNELVSSLIENIKAKGVRQSMTELTLTIMNERIYDPVVNIYKDVGVYHANRNYRFIRSQINQKGLGRNQFWIDMIIDYLKRTLLQHSVLKTTETLRNQLLEILQDGVDKGLGEFEITEMIREQKLAVVQSQRIVRTEINRAANTGVKVSADSFGYEMQKEWIAHRDMRTRGRTPDDKKDHYHMNGQTVDLDMNFREPKTSEEIEYPSAPGGSAGMVINCRCTYATVVKRDENGRLIKKQPKTILPGVSA